jgi:hypothetical protein
MADQVLKYYIANTYLTNVPLLGLLLLGVIYSEDAGFTYQFLCAFRCCYVIFQMSVVTIAATTINTQVCKAFTSLHQLSVTVFHQYLYAWINFVCFIVINIYI